MQSFFVAMPNQSKCNITIVIALKISVWCESSRVCIYMDVILKIIVYNFIVNDWSRWNSDGGALYRVPRPWSCTNKLIFSGRIFLTQTTQRYQHLFVLSRFNLDVEYIKNASEQNSCYEIIPNKSILSARMLIRRNPLHFLFIFRSKNSGV